MKNRMQTIVILLISLILLDAVFIVSVSSVIFDAKSVFIGETEPCEDIGALSRYCRNRLRYPLELESGVTSASLIGMETL